mgnify:CR=1 FL=1
MTITFKIEKPDAIVRLKARRTMAGDVMIYDHPDIDVIVSPSKNKVLTLPKKQYGSHIYATQSRLFEYLSKRGVIDPSTVRGGNIFGCLEGSIAIVSESQQADTDPFEVAIYSVAKFFQYEAPFFDKYKQYEDDIEKELTDPTDEDSTELGKIPHEPRQGAVAQYPGSSLGYGMTGTH